MSRNKPTYRDLVYEIVQRIPTGKVARYGQIASLVPGCTARMVGYALAALPADLDVPWQRVINAKGKISPHGAGFGSALQFQLLLDEGVVFDIEGRTNFDIYGWHPDR
jgi:methylated-DNA-protein-cysteine methyltransferase-like protein